MALPAASATAQTGGVTHVDTVAAPSLRENLLGDPARRGATVYLPPGYSTQKTKRYPVVYLLHGYAANHRAFMGGAYQNLNVRISMDSLIRAGRVREMIVVMPNARNAFDGSFYANSPVTGGWEDFIATDLVRHVDRKYRTIANRRGRGIAGHSMGGYGALRIGMKHPDKFAALYALSPCCLGSLIRPEGALTRAWKSALKLKTREEFATADFFPSMFYALASVYSPNPAKPPFYVDLPFRLSGDSLVMIPDVAARWTQTPLAMATNYAANLKRMAVAVDAGKGDGILDIPINVSRLYAAFDANGIRYVGSLYDGTHGSRIRERLESYVFPFFSTNLK